ncbi:MAG: GMC oxidoreductase [Nitrososphaerota archaeon]|nr:GMC oxidoreductase [Candidatus Nezhaarchaeota archaeon]MDW8050081.1 GMC oxidoreductase [Nitrososphaerota archaeon]
MLNVDVAVIGSGAGGSIAAFELTRRGFNVTLLEEEEEVDVKHSYRKYYPTLSSIEILRTKCLGGSTLVSLGNMVLDDFIISKLKACNIDITEEANIVKHLMQVVEVPQHMLSPFSEKFIDVSRSMGFNPRIMPKSIRFDKCVACGRCAYGCPNDAKFTALDLIASARKRGLTVVTGFKVKRLHRRSPNGAWIIEGFKDGGKVTVNCEALVIAAGALDVPSLLSQICDDERIGQGLFIDPFVTVGGPYDGPSSSDGIPMSVYVDFGEFIISPHYSGLLPFQLRSRGVQHEGRHVASVMVKVADEGKGTVWPNGIIEARMTKRDLEMLRKGIELAKALLVDMGVKESEIVVTHVRGAHPGGTAAIGHVVSKDLTISDCDGVFIADASLVPPPLGRPPMLLIMALALKVSHKVYEYLV